MTRLTRVKAMVGEVIQYGGNCRGFSDNIHCKGYALERGALDVTALERGRRTAPADGGGTHPQEGSSSKAAVAGLVARINQGTATDSYFVDVLKEGLKRKDFELVKQVHECFKKSHLTKNTYVFNHLLKSYIECGGLQSASELFSNFTNKNIFSWAIMIGGYADNDQSEDALEAYKQLREGGGQPDAVTYVAVLKACAGPSALSRGRAIHADIVHDGIQDNLRVGNALVSMYAKCGNIEDAKTVFSKMKIRDVVTHNAMIAGLGQHGHLQEAFSLFHRMQSEAVSRNVVTWNAIISGYAQHGFGQDAYYFFVQMQTEGFTPNMITYLCILNPCSCNGSLGWVKKVHAHAMKVGLDVDVRVGNSLVHMYAKSGSIKDARVVFDRLERRDIFSWTVLIGGLAEHGFGQEAFSLFLQMQREGFTPNVITYLSILDSCSSTGALEWVKEVHAHASRAGLDVDVRVGNALVNMYAKTGMIADARHVFDRMPSRDIISWTVMIGGLAQHGYSREALQLFDRMKVKGVKPDTALYVALLSACSHAGLVDEGRFLFLSMRRDHAVEPSLEHYNCVVDMLGRAGHLEEAKLYIFNLPIKPDDVTWKALLGACRIHNNIELAELAANKCVELDPTDASPYVLLSNVYAAAGNWNQVSLIRNRMHKRGIRKIPGRCWIEIGDKVHHFSVGDKSHPETREIFAMLSSLSKKLKDEGYTVDTRLVLRDVSEDDKEIALCSHSEKLAIAYGLIHVPAEEPIRVYENLRICTDCHAATKLISKITGREIVARDANRFHHFKDGLCSCNDYW